MVGHWSNFFRYLSRKWPFLTLFVMYYIQCPSSWLFSTLHNKKCQKRVFPGKISKKVTSMTHLNIGFYLYIIESFVKNGYFLLNKVVMTAVFTMCQYITILHTLRSRWALIFYYNKWDFFAWYHVFMTWATRVRHTKIYKKFIMNHPTAQCTRLWLTWRKSAGSLRHALQISYMPHSAILAIKNFWPTVHEIGFQIWI